MCGIAGVVRWDGRPVLEREVRAMCAAMVHRGPDDEGIYVSDGVAIGMRRDLRGDRSGLGDPVPPRKLAFHRHSPFRSIGRATNRPSAATKSSCGPQSGQQLGWAWNRRSDMSWYSAEHLGHIAKGAMVVAGRSYGMPVMIE